jgi:hypothetical protein
MWFLAWPPGGENITCCMSGVGDCYLATNDKTVLNGRGSWQFYLKNVFELWRKWSVKILEVEMLTSTIFPK